MRWKGNWPSSPIPTIPLTGRFSVRSLDPSLSWQNPQAFYRTNVMGAVNVLEHCRRDQAALTLISSYVYGQPQRLPIAEDHPLAAANPYAHTKILAEQRSE